MNKRNKSLIIFGISLLVIALVVMVATMLCTGEIKPEYFTSTPAIMCYIMIGFAVLTIGYVFAADWIKRL